VVLTDLPEVCPLLQADARGYAGVEVRPLSWGSTGAPSTHKHCKLSSTLRQSRALFASGVSQFPSASCVYFPLLRTLLHLTAADPRVVISYKIRSLTKEMAFWSAFGLWFTFAPVLMRAR
ncbi:hypothetical protein EDB85DRAFT_1842180, partial [Lactarius pseudohatsudake]